MSAPAIAPRRVARIQISPDFIGTLIGLPDELKVRTLQYDPIRDEAVLIVEGEHLDEVCEGAALTAIRPVYTLAVDVQADAEIRTLHIVGINGYDGPFTPRVLRVEKIEPAPQDDGSAARVLGGAP